MDAIRIGNFTSSKIGALMSNGKAKDSLGKPALTYINEKNMERKLGRILSNETDSRPTLWGNCVEPYVFKYKLGINYEYRSGKTIRHPDIDYWCGTPDADKHGPEKAAGEIKSPFTLKSFCTLVDAWNKGGIQAIREEHDSGEEWYYQCVSHAILTKNDYAELIAFCPYKYELDLIRLIAQDNPKYSWIVRADDDELPYLLDNGHYKNLNVMRFEVPQSDKDALTERVLESGKKLIKSI